MEPVIIFILHLGGHELHGLAVLVALDLHWRAVDLREKARLPVAGIWAASVPVLGSFG
jgi:hypothetical protein